MLTDTCFYSVGIKFPNRREGGILCLVLITSVFAPRWHDPFLYAIFLIMMDRWEPNLHG